MTDAPDNEREETPARPPLTRSSRHRVVAGVCGGLGRYLDIDPVVFRVVVAVLGLTGGLGLFLYGLAWLVVPREAVGADGDDGRSEVQRVLTGRVDGQSIGAVLLTVIGTGVFFSSMGDGDQLFPLLLLGGLVFLAVRYDPERRRRAHGEPGHGRPGASTPGPRDRLADSGEPVDWTTWGRRLSADLRNEWEARASEVHERMTAAHRAHAEARESGKVPSDTPPAGPSGYLWDPRHPERNPYQGTTPPPGAPAQAWWQRTDLPEGDPLRKRPLDAEGGAAAPVKVVRHRSYLGPLAVLASIGAGTAAFLVGRDHPGLPLTAVLAAALLPLGLAMLVGTRWGRVRGLAVPAMVLTLALAGAAGSAATVDSTFGDRNWTVTSAAELQPHYSLGAGDVKLDLSGLDPAGATLTTEVRLGAGDLTVTVPDDVEVRLTVRNGLGEVTLPGGEKISGGGTDRDVQLHPTGGQAAKGTLDLTVLVGLGDAEVVQG
ncbi:PspC domain-containing protein [Kitasatospora sp. NPDC048365]|uniref:PspC domain-containing protein n=1 Tax=Kitasatospora sp. NPDC048365 TaxID=3364050 RepID=UPI0037134A47